MQDTTDDFNWTRNANTTISKGTGPTKDHTDGTVTGHYMYLESSCKLYIDIPDLYRLTYHVQTYLLTLYKVIIYSCTYHITV